MALVLKKIGNLETLAQGYTHEVEFDASELSTTAGSAQSTAVQFPSGSALAGVIAKASIEVKELVTASVSTGSAISNATISCGDDDVDGFVAIVNCFTGDTNNLEYVNTGALLNGATATSHLVSQFNVSSNGTGNGFGNASKGKFKLLVAYYPTAGSGLNS
jgi:hypothetical protein